MQYYSSQKAVLGLPVLISKFSRIWNLKKINLKFNCVKLIQIWVEKLRTQLEPWW